MKTANPENADVQAFCQTISPTPPVFVKIAAREDCTPKDSFGNVRKQIDRFGGEMRTGWSIRDWPGAYIEAEHHAVYDPGNGAAWVDVTPGLDGETHRLFVADETATYNPATPGVRRDTIRKAHVNDPLIHELFRVVAEKTRLMNMIPGVGMAKVPPALGQPLALLGQRHLQLSLEVSMRYTSRNDPCFCQSGKKFKQCHGAKSA